MQPEEVGQDAAVHGYVTDVFAVTFDDRGSDLFVDGCVPGLKARLFSRWLPQPRQSRQDLRTRISFGFDAFDRRGRICVRPEGAIPPHQATVADSTQWGTAMRC